MTSDELLLLVLTQVWQVAIIAVFVWVLIKAIFKNQPQMSHLLWGLVLIKAITPPIWSSPTSVFSWLGQRTTQPNYVTAARQPASSQPGPFTSSLIIDLQRETHIDTVGSGFTDKRTSGAWAADETTLSTARSGLMLVTRSLLVIWLGGVVFLIVASAIRVVAFWRWMRRKLTGQCAESRQRRRLQLQEDLQACTIAMAAELGIRRRVQIYLTIAPIGPAVVGLFRPAIILPVQVVEDRPLEFLKPLIAHELVHIRRGDLFWALLQSMATSLLWFHPLVWLASRRLTVESERSCDEQTIAWLGCSPAAYARSLIDVLERKHQLRVAPVLPGVRPVDVTRNRLERIMRLGQGCRKQTPIWAWGLFVVAVAMVLPGAAFIGAQEGADFSRPAGRSPDGPQPSPDSQQMAVEATKLVDSQVEVGDLLEILKASGRSEEQSRNILISLLSQRLRQPIFRGNSDKTISQSPNARIEGTNLRFVGTPEQIADVKGALAERRRMSFRQTALQVRLITVHKTQLDQLNIPWHKAAPLPDDQFGAGLFKEEALASSHSSATLELQHPAKQLRQDVFSLADGTIIVQPEATPAGYYYTPSAETVPPKTNATVSFDVPRVTELQVPAIPMPAFYAVVGNDASRKALDIALSDARTNVLQAPRVTAYNATTIHINDTVQRPFVTDVTPVSGEAGTTDLPTIEIAVEGIKLVAQPIVDADGTMELLFALNERRLQQVESFTYDRSVGSDPSGNPTDSGTTVQIPQLVSRYLVLKSNMKLGESLFVTSAIPTLNAVGSGGDEVLIAVATVSDVQEVDEHLKQKTQQGED